MPKSIGINLFSLPLQRKNQGNNMNNLYILLPLPIFFMIHELEEIIMVKSWITRNIPLLYERFPRLKPVISKMGLVTTQSFATIALEELLIVIVCTAISLYTHNIIPWYCCLAAFVIHLVIHLIQFLVWRRYIPAILTTLICLPYCIWAIRETSLFLTLKELSQYAITGLIIGGINLIAMHWLMGHKHKRHVR